MSLRFDNLTASQKVFVIRVCGDLNRNHDAAQIAVIGDGSASPNGEKFAAERAGNSWNVVFDFGTGRCFHTAVQLPNDWHAESLRAQWSAESARQRVGGTFGS